MKNSDKIENNSPTIPEQPMPSKENQSLRLTPEQRAKSEAASKRLSEAMIQGLHQDNLEIFGEDYIKK